MNTYTHIHTYIHTYIHTWRITAYRHRARRRMRWRSPPPHRQLRCPALTHSPNPTIISQTTTQGMPTWHNTEFILFLYTNLYKHTYIHTYIHRCIHVLYIHTSTLAEVHNRWTFKHTSTYIHTYIHTCIRTYVYVYIHLLYFRVMVKFHHKAVETIKGIYIHTYIYR
jgi:hypothetical protein